MHEPGERPVEFRGERRAIGMQRVRKAALEKTWFERVECCSAELGMGSCDPELLLFRAVTALSSKIQAVGFQPLASFRL